MSANFIDLCVSQQAISNARMHWELLRSQTRSLIRICAGEQDDSLSTNNLAIRRSKNLTEVS
jgi:hypothetical protein